MKYLALVVLLAGPLTIEARVISHPLTVDGIVMENLTERATVDGPTYFILQTKAGETYRVYYHPGDAENANGKASLIGFGLRAGQRVRVRAHLSEFGTLVTYRHATDFIQVLEEPHAK